MSLFSKLLVISAALALLVPGPGLALKDYVLAPLALSVFFSLLGSKNQFRLSWGPIKDGIIYNYLILTVGLVLLSSLMPPGIREGVMLYAIFPPAVGVMALSAQWGGKPEDVFVFQILSYVASLVFVPLAALALIGSTVDASVLLTYLVVTFIIPALASVFFRPKNKELMADISGVFLAALFYIVIAKSQAWMVANWQTALMYAIPLAALCFAFGYAVMRFTKDPDALLYSFLKNGGAAAAASLAILPEASTAIISLKTFVDVVLIMVFGMLWNRK